MKTDESDDGYITFRDMWNRPVFPGDRIAYASTARLWIGKITDMRTFRGDSYNTYQIQMATEDMDGNTRKLSFDYVPSKMFRIEETNG